MTQIEDTEGNVTGSVELAEVYGGFGPVTGSILWRGACVGGCGARPGCREDEPSPECSGCGRTRHGITGDGSAVGRIVPVVARVLPGELDAPTPPRQQPDAAPTPVGPHVLRSGVEVSHDDASLPSAVRGLLRLAGPAARVTAAVAVRPAGAIVASLAVRVPGVGFAVYTRCEGADGWSFENAVLVAPRLRAVGARAFAAVLAGVEYVPPAPRPPATKVPCPGCGAEVSTTKDGTIFRSHRCKTTKVEGRS